MFVYSHICKCWHDSQHSHLLLQRHRKSQNAYSDLIANGPLRFTRILPAARSNAILRAVLPSTVWPSNNASNSTSYTWQGARRILEHSNHNGRYAL
jgi:hypothetical protein